MRIKLWLVVMLGIFGCVSVQAKNCEGYGKSCKQKVVYSKHKNMSKLNKRHNEKALHHSPLVKGMYVVKVNQLNIRNEPGHHGKVHGRFHGGQTVQVFAIIDGWAKVLYNGHYQWVSAQYLQLSVR